MRLLTTYLAVTFAVFFLISPFPVQSKLPLSPNSSSASLGSPSGSPRYKGTPMEIARQQQYDRYAKTAGQPGSDVDKKDLKQMDKFIKPNFIRTARLAYTQELNHKIPDPNKRSTLQKLLAYSDKKMNAINKVTANTRELEPSKHNPAHWALRSVTGLSNKYATFRSRHRSA